MSASRCSPRYPSRKCSATVRPKNTPRPSGTWAMPSRARAGGRPPGDVGAVDADRARHRAHEARDRSQRGRLAGTVGAEQGDDLAGADVEVELAHDRRRVVAGRQRFELEHRVSAHHAPSARPCRSVPRLRPSL